VMMEAGLSLAPIARERSTALADAGVEPGSYLVLTLHRASNTVPGPLRDVAGALAEIAEPVVFPVHPRTQAALTAAGVELPANVRILPPVGYLDLAALASQARVVLTDSGGLQKEAYWYGVPCVTLRTTTEWVETVETGWNRLVGTEPNEIVKAVRDADPAPTHPQLYGDGQAAKRIADVLCSLPAR
jgi:UDP-GlcNAc3NAcA epimerase